MSIAVFVTEYEMRKDIIFTIWNLHYLSSARASSCVDADHWFCVFIFGNSRLYRKYSVYKSI